jgi:hypothetical protein
MSNSNALRLSDLNESQGPLRLSDLNESQGPLRLSDLNESQGPLRLSDLNNGGKSRKRKRNKKHKKKTRKSYKKNYKKRKTTKKNRIRKIRGGDVDKLGDADFNANLAYDAKQYGGQNIGANCNDPNFSIYNTRELTLFPYKPN